MPRFSRARLDTKGSRPALCGAGTDPHQPSQCASCAKGGLTGVHPHSRALCAFFHSKTFHIPPCLRTASSSSTLRRKSPAYAPAARRLTHRCTVHTPLPPAAFFSTQVSVTVAFDARMLILLNSRHRTPYAVHQQLVLTAHTPMTTQPPITPSTVLTGFRTRNADSDQD
ncbi:hypothetical protein D9615_009027 [Tricholomella constricta]|uniref:Uncharacterized protein n=1 Tax=Tricholomella constricta TaxID=117010 RepID=A0A8H5H0I4_9AGAR|nr:hypothetical protein D9615_009027 [Tricholomella constricta]